MIFSLFFLILFLLLWVVCYALGPALQRLLKALAHRVAAYRYRDYLPVLLVLASGLALSLLAGHAFEELAEAVHANSPILSAFDQTIHDWAVYTRSDGSTRLFVIMTMIGTPVGIGILVAVLSGLLVMQGRWRWAAYLIWTNGVGGVINLGLKGLFQRARPDLAEALRQAHGYSFPSGHAMGSMIFFGTVAYLAVRITPGWRSHAAAVALPLTFALAISASRIYLGVHWISDVAAGMSAGAVWLLTSTVAYETSRRIRRVRARTAAPASELAP